MLGRSRPFAAVFAALILVLASQIATAEAKLAKHRISSERPAARSTPTPTARSRASRSTSAATGSAAAARCSRAVPRPGVLGDGPQRARLRRVRRAHAVRDRRHRGAGLVRGDQERALRAARHAQGGRAAHRRRAAGRERRDPERPQPLRARSARRVGRRARRVPAVRHRPHRRGDRRRVRRRWCPRRSTTGPRTGATCSRTSSTTTRPTRPSTPTCACCRRATARSRSSRC